MKADCAQFSRFYVKRQNQEGDLQEFFQDENHPWPLSLVQADRMREGQRSDVANCLEKVIAATGDYTEVHPTILDGAVIIQMASPGAAQTFQGHADNVLMPYIMTQFQPVKRIDAIWDVYRQDGLKAATGRREGVVHVEGQHHLPKF